MMCYRYVLMCLNFGKKVFNVVLKLVLITPNNAQLRIITRNFVGHVDWLAFKKKLILNRLIFDWLNKQLKNLNRS